MELFARVKDVFTISGRGVVVPIQFISQDGKIRVGDRVCLKNPDGTAHETHVRGVEFLCSPGTHPRKPCQTGLMLELELRKENILPDAEIHIFPEVQMHRTNEKSACQIWLGNPALFPYNYSLS
jgi:hypothetical protein